MSAAVATAGHNSQDPHAIARADVEQRIDAFIDGADIWEQRGDLDDDLAARANDFLAGARRLFKEAEEARKAEKAPHMEAAKAVDAAWAVLTARIEKVAAVVKPKLEAFMRRKQREAAEAKAAAEKRAREAENARLDAVADAALAETPSQRIAAEERADAHAAAVDAATHDAARAGEKPRVDSATGLATTRALRTVRRARIVSIAQALAHYRDRPEVEALILQLANAELRAAPTLRGVKQVPTVPGVAFDETQEL